MTQQKFHVNPETGEAGACEAFIRDCIYSNGGNEYHYGTMDEAEAAGKAILTERYGAFNTMKRAKSPTFDREELKAKLESATLQEISEFVESSKRNFDMVDEVVKYRSESVPANSEQLRILNPANKLVSRPASPEVFKMMVEEHEQYRHETAELVEALNESPYFKPAYKKVKNAKRIGKAVRAGDLVVNSEEWFADRSNSVGGSDVATLVMRDFTPEEDQPSYLESRYERIVQNKTIVGKDAPKPFVNKATYRGTVWEQRIKDQFAKDNPQLKVYEVDGQFVNPDRPWQKINVDGVLSSREDGVPDGILEIKTGSNPKDWENGIPESYRAQVLYYLNATGMQYARVCAVINDHETFDYYLGRDEEIVPGSKVNMETYINKRVKPWFQGLKAQQIVNATV